MGEDDQNSVDPLITFTWTPSKGVPTIDPTVRLIGLKENRRSAGWTILGGAIMLVIGIGGMLLLRAHPDPLPQWRLNCFFYIFDTLFLLLGLGMVFSGSIKLFTHKRSMARNTALPKCQVCGETSNLTWSSFQFNCLKCDNAYHFDASGKHLGRVVSEGLQCVRADCRSPIS